MQQKLKLPVNETEVENQKPDNEEKVDPQEPQMYISHLVENHITLQLVTTASFHSFQCVVISVMIYTQVELHY